MKKLFLVLIFLLVSVGISFAASLNWDAAVGVVDGYNVYYTDGTTTFNHDAGNVLTVTDIDTTLQLLPDTAYLFTVMGYNQAGEAPVSNTVEYTTAAGYVPPPDVMPIIVTRPTTITIIIE